MGGNGSVTVLSLAGGIEDSMDETTTKEFLAENPGQLTGPLRALWHDAHGNWKAALEVAQADEQDRDSAWVHAYLHRKEGDAFNARYWYRRAGRPVYAGSLEDEWDAMTAALLPLKD